MNKEKMEMFAESTEYVLKEKVLRKFIIQSWSIEGYKIGGDALDEALLAHKTLFNTIEKNTSFAIQEFCGQYGGKLRDKIGLNVRVGNHVPPEGGPDLKVRFENLCDDIDRMNANETIVEFHKRYETLHPFTDVNGRSGRAILFWQMDRIGNYEYLALENSFLHFWYYQSLR